MERSFEGEPAGFWEIEGACVIGETRRFQENGVRTGRKFESGGSVAVKFSVNEDFSGVRIGNDGDCAEAVWGRG